MDLNKVKQISKLYEDGLSTTKIAKMFGYKTAKSIGDILKSNGINLRTSKESGQLVKTYNDGFLNIIDCDWKGYFLGLMLTDGWIVEDKNTAHLNLIDEDCISFLSNCIGKNYLKYPPRTSRHQPSFRINLAGEDLLKALRKRGVVARKTYHVPDIILSPQEFPFLKSIIRGIIDGDGTIGLPTNSDGAAFITITSASKNFLVQIKSWLENLGFENINIKEPKTGLVHKLNICGFANIQLAKYLIYRNPFGMKRKRQKLFQAAYPSDWDKKILQMRELP